MGMNSASDANFGASCKARDGMDLGAVTRNTYRFVFESPEAYGIKLTAPDGTVRYCSHHVEDIENLTTNTGRQNALTNNFKGSGYSAAWFMALISNTSFGSIAVGDTAAKITTSTPSSPTTNDWAESTGYSEGTRPAITFGTATIASPAVLDSSAAPSTFSINTTVALYGGFLISNSTKGGTTGVIYGEGAFSTVVSLGSGSTVTVYVTLSLATA